jgi:hypothetical protein
MKGSIRVFVGLIMTLGAAGGFDTAADSDLLSLSLIAIAGLGIMVSGVMAMNRRY